MRVSAGKILEVRLEPGGGVSAFVACPKGAIPGVGQYILAYAWDEADIPLPTALFAAEIQATGFWAAPPLPPGWRPGTELVLHAPQGRGFVIPREARRVGLVALGERLSRLLPLIAQAARQGSALSLVTDLSLPPLPSSVEVYPLESVQEVLSWADYLALDLPLEALARLRQTLELGRQDHLSCPAQALLYTEMPCGGVAECGACAIPTKRGWKLACVDGPVFDLGELDW